MCVMLTTHRRLTLIPPPLSGHHLKIVAPSAPAEHCIRTSVCQDVSLWKMPTYFLIPFARAQIGPQRSLFVPHSKRNRTLRLAGTRVHPAESRHDAFAPALTRRRAGRTNDDGPAIGLPIPDSTRSGALGRSTLVRTTARQRQPLWSDPCTCRCASPPCIQWHGGRSA